MNQRIKELAEQSGAWEYYEINEGVDGDENPLEKFAELIVKECVVIALEQKKWIEDQVVCNPRDKEWNLAKIQQSQRIVDKIEEHFRFMEDEKDYACPLCGEDSGTTCGMPQCQY